jgi:hypothetical protein
MRSPAFVTIALLVVSAAGCSSGSSNTTAGTSYPCYDRQLVADQAGFAQGTISVDQFVDVCGRVTSVRRARVSRSGRHGYFYVAVSGSARPIEVVSNLDAMSRARSDAPPPWPWVAAGDYVFVQGRYYYDSDRRQGIDWTEADESAAWPHAGYVVVCNASVQNCILYR